MEANTGTLLLGRFRVVAERGRPGGAGLYDAIDEPSGRSVHLVLLRDVAAGEEPERALERASRYAIGCRGIARFLAAGVVGAGEGGASSRTRQVVVAYEAAGERTLDDLIRSGTRVESAEVARIVTLVARAVSPLHDQGVAHAYLRPGLITLTDDGVLLEGFGVAQLAQSLGGPGLARDALPTVYRAPELRGAMPAKAETWADVYALGVLATELIAGRQVPARLEIPTPRALGLEVGDALESAIAQAVAASVGARPREVELWALRLEAALSESAAVPDAGRVPRGDEAAESAPAAEAAAESAQSTAATAGSAATAQATTQSVAATDRAAASGAEPEAAGQDARAMQASGQLALDAKPARQSAPPPESARSAAAAPVGATAPDAESSPPEPTAAEQKPAVEVVAPVAPDAERASALPQVPERPIASPASASAGGSTWLVALAVVGGMLLMIAGVGAAFWFALARSPKSAATPPRTVVFGPAGPTPTASAPALPGTPMTGSSSPDGGLASSALPEPAPLPSGQPVHRESAADVPLPIDRDDPVWGKPDAPVTLMVFGDLDCPYTRRSFDVLERLETRFSGELRLVWKNRPLDMHPHASDAAKVAIALQATRGDAAFWKFASLVASASQPSTTARLTRWVSDAGGDGTSVSAWLSDPRYEKRIERALSLAGRYNIRSTPTFFINGLRVEGYQPFGALERVVQKELKRARALSATGVAARDVYTARVRKNLIDLGPAVPDRTCPSVAQSPVRGPDDALVTIVVFSDFQCPYCKRAQSTLQELRVHYGNDVRMVWKNFPLSFHERARPAANFALEALARGGTGAFWRVHDALFAAQPSLDDATLGRIAHDVGLDPVPLLQSARDSSHRSAIDADVREGKSFGVSGTPTFFVNGRELDGALPLSKFESVVNAELVNAKRLIASGVSRRHVYAAVCAGH